MKKLMLAVVLTSAAWAVAQEPSSQAQQPQQPQQPAQTAKDSKEMTATVVSTDPTVKTITFKKEAAVGAAGTVSEQTVAVDDKALANLKTIKVGEKVKLVLKTDPMTGKESVTSIEKPKSSEQEPR